MNKTERNFWLDSGIFFVSFMTISTGFLLWLIMPHTYQATYLGIQRNILVNIHILFGIFSLVGIVVHIIWHFDWLRALRGKSLKGLPKKVHANRIIDKLIWITFIATNVLGITTWALISVEEIYRVSIFDRLHVIFGVIWTLITIIHLVFHKKWIVKSTKRFIQLEIPTRVGVNNR